MSAPAFPAREGDVPLILASQSRVRGDVLRGAGLTFTQVRSPADEDAIKASLLAERIAPRDLADALAEAKAVAVSATAPGWVIGADQVLDLEGRVFDKPVDLEGAGSHLRALSGRTHRLHSAVVLATGGSVVWRHVESPRLTVRPLSEETIAAYLAAAGPEVCNSVGAYQLEGLGSHLFSKIEGDYFSILGLPLLALLGQLRELGVVQ